MDVFKNLDQIYKRLVDKESEYIFEKRLLYSLSNDIGYIDQIVTEKFYTYMIERFRNVEIMENEVLVDLCNILKNKKIVIYGAGGYGLLYAALFKSGVIGGAVLGYFDKYKTDNFVGLKAIDISTIKQDEIYLLITQKDIALKNEIEKELKKWGVEDNRILRFDKIDLMSYTGIYYPDFFELKKEVFIDGGCYDGNSSLALINNCKDYKKIYAFEPDKENIKLIEKNFVSEKMEVFPFGLWDKKDTLYFSRGGQASKIDETGEEMIDVNSIDNCVDDCVTYIKMDIEGAEIKALIGAKKMIQKYHPKLAISIYHKREDIIDIPLTILQIEPRYKFYLRHYSPGSYDTVLYAVVE